MAMMDPLFHYQFRIILIGDSTVGKSSLLRYFTEGKPAEICDPTVGVDFYARLVEIQPGLRIKLQLWDTAGQEKFRSITRSYYKVGGAASSAARRRGGRLQNAVGVMVVYDIANRQTFEHVAEWMREARANLGGPCPDAAVFALVGQKTDLPAEQRQVLYEEGEYFAKYHRVKFAETSAISGANIEEAFLLMGREIFRRLEADELCMADGWDGVRTGMMHASAISLADSDAAPERPSCPC